MSTCPSHIPERCPYCGADSCHGEQFCLKCGKQLTPDLITNNKISKNKKTIKRQKKLYFQLLVPTVLISLLMGIVVPALFFKQNCENYNSAVALISKGDIFTAIPKLKSLHGFADSAELLEKADRTEMFKKSVSIEDASAIFLWDDVLKLVPFFSMDEYLYSLSNRRTAEIAVYFLSENEPEYALRALAAVKDQTVINQIESLLAAKVADNSEMTENALDNDIPETLYEEIIAEVTATPIPAIIPTIVPTPTISSTLFTATVTATPTSEVSPLPSSFLHTLQPVTASPNVITPVPKPTDTPSLPANTLSSTITAAIVTPEITKPPVVASTSTPAVSAQAYATDSSVCFPTETPLIVCTPVTPTPSPLPVVTATPDPRESDYAKAKEAFRSGYFWTAEKTFDSLADYKDSTIMGKQCIQPYPSTGELFRKSGLKKSGSQLRIDNSANDIPVVYCVYDTSDELCLKIFVAAGRSWYSKCPPGKYQLLEAGGKKWYGEKEYFGDDGYYITLINDDSSCYFTLEDGYETMITTGFGSKDAIETNEVSLESFSGGPQ